MQVIDFVKLKKKTPGGGPAPDMWGGLDLDGHGLYNESIHEVLHSSHPLLHPFTPFTAWQLVHFIILSLATTYQQATRSKYIVYGGEVLGLRLAITSLVTFSTTSHQHLSIYTSTSVLTLPMIYLQHF